MSKRIKNTQGLLCMDLRCPVWPPPEFINLPDHTDDWNGDAWCDDHAPATTPSERRTTP